MRHPSWASPDQIRRGERQMMSPASSSVRPTRDVDIASLSPNRQQQRQRQQSPGGASLTGEGDGDVWDALTNIFSDMDNQGGAGDEQDALAETLESLRGLLDMHRQLKKKTVGLNAKREEMARERDAALERLEELQRMEAQEQRMSMRRSSMQQAWGAYADLEEDEIAQHQRRRRHG